MKKFILNVSIIFMALVSSIFTDTNVDNEDKIANILSIRATMAQSEGGGGGVTCYAVTSNCYWFGCYMAWQCGNPCDYLSVDSVGSAGTC